MPQVQGETGWVRAHRMIPIPSGDVVHGRDRAERWRGTYEDWR